MKFKASKKTSFSLSDFEKLFLEKCDKFFEPDIRGKFKGTAVLPYKETVTFNVPGVKYTPDFIGITPDNEIVVIEIKGSKRQRGFYYTRARMIAAHVLLPLFHFIVVEVKKEKEADEWGMIELSREY